MTHIRPGPNLSPRMTVRHESRLSTGGRKIMKNLLKGAGIALLLSGGSAMANDSVIAEIAKPQQWAMS